MSEQEPYSDLVAIEIDEAEGVATIRVTADRGWTVQARVENSPDYLGDGVESKTASAQLMLRDEEAIAGLAYELQGAANELALLKAEEGADDA